MYCGTRRPGKGPRQQLAIFEATLTLLAERGYDGLTIEGVAALAKVNKTTIYRWWPSKDSLLSAALIESRTLEPTIPDTGSLRGDLLVIAEQVLRLLSSEPGSSITRTALVGGDRPGLAEAARQFSADRLAKEEEVFTRAVARGEIAAGTDPSTVIDLLAGAIWFRVLIRQTPVPADFAEQLVNTVVEGLSSNR